jgi:hypothetical protein
MNARAIYNQRAAIGIEEVVPHTEALGGAPRPGRVIADVELHMNRAGVQLHELVAVRGVHE